MTIFVGLSPHYVMHKLTGFYLSHSQLAHSESPFSMPSLDDGIGSYHGDTLGIDPNTGMMRTTQHILLIILTI